MKSWLMGKTFIRICNVAQCYNVSKVNVAEVINIPRVLEVLPIVVEIEKEAFYW